VPPLKEYNIAAAAMEAAKRQGANDLAPGYWTKAESHYRRGKKAFDQDQFQEAKEEFESARINAEKAENFAALKKAKSGGDD
jgi:uncharacterized protein HemY